MAKVRKLNILHLNAGTNLGGTETMLLRFLDKVDKGYFQSSVGAFFNNGPLLTEVKKRGFEGIEFRINNRLNPFDVLSALVKLYHFLKTKKIDIIHMYGFYTNILGRIVARRAKTPIVITGLRMEKFGRNGLHSLLERMTSNWSDLYISVSGRGRELILKKSWIPPNKVVVVHNGIESDWANGRIRNTQSTNIGMIADFNKFKAQEEVVLAAPKILEKFPNARFVLAGKGETKKSIVEMINHLGLNSFFTLPGLVSDVQQVLSQLSIFVLATHTEGLPVSILEAMSFGLPVVATKVGGIPELVEDGVTGILVKPNSPVEIASAIIKLLSDPGKANRMGEAGKSKVRKEFSLEQMMQRLQQHYLDLAVRKGLQ
jgi:glycosyltransferase involved in cell wall biosynthesis